MDLTTKTWRAMKLTALFVFAVCMSASARSWSQVNLDEKDAPLQEVFRKIRQQTGYDFVVAYVLLQNAGRVSVHLKNASLQQALETCLAGKPLTYSILEKTVVIKRKSEIIARKEQSKAGPIDVRGRVVNEKGDPVEAVTVTVKGSNTKTLTDKNGEFSLATVDKDAVLVFTHVSMQSFEMKVSGMSEIAVTLKARIRELGDVVVSVNTGYQEIPKERATGSFVKVDKELINRRVGTNILDRLDGVTSGVYFRDLNNSIPNNSALNSLSRASTGITIRGETSLASSAQVSRDPLIVLDNFPYEGNLSNINPNDIESITILKDAAAASIWGARAGNGVIVITTKRGKINQKMKVEFNSNVTVAEKPNLKKDPSYLSSSDYIDLEQQLFNLNYYTPDITNTSSFPVLTPVVEILAKQKAGLISSADADAQINALRGNDLRDEFNKYIYQKGIRQQYSVGFSGGSNNIAYQLSVGYDKNDDNLIRNNYERFTINTNNIYSVSKRLEISTSINYSQSTTDGNNNLPYNSIIVGNKTGKLYPYAKLADDNGAALPVGKDLRGNYVDSVQKLGFLDWKYRPLDEIKNADQSVKVNDLLLRVGLQYKILRDLNFNLDYQKETQRITNRGLNNQSLYFTRNQINTFTQYDPVTKKFTYPFPKGSILDRGNYVWNSNSLRAKLAYNTVINHDHMISSIAGAEVRELKNEGSSSSVYGYDENIGTANGLIDYTSFFNTNPNSSGFIIPFPGSESKIVSRFVSFYANASYGFKDRYIFSVSGRKEGSNIFGVSTNQRITPLWSTGLKWNIDKESFYKFSWLPLLSMRLTYGFSGNVYNGSAYTTGTISRNSLGAQTIINLTAPNPELRWEKIRTINLGVDFSAKNKIVDGSIEIYQKNGQDLIQPISTPGSTGFTSFIGNAANTRIQGIDLNLTSRFMDVNFRWQPTLLLSFITDKVMKYNVPVTSSLLRQATGGPVEGHSLYSLFSYKWGGLDPATGDPQGVLDKTVTNNYSTIVNIANPDSMVYHGSSLPRIFGSFRNDFSYKGFSLSVNITYKFNYYFRRSSTSLNLTDVVSYRMHQDYVHRWQAPGDESVTNIPSVIFNANNNRNTFYQYSETLVERGDHIRMNDIRISYDIPNRFINKAGFNGLRAYTYVNNPGIIWRKNSRGIDPDTYSYDGVDRTPTPRSIAFGIQASF